MTLNFFGKFFIYNFVSYVTSEGIICLSIKIINLKIIIYKKNVVFMKTTEMTLLALQKRQLKLQF